MDVEYCLPVEPEPCGTFKLEAVIVCANYSDFLRETLPHNKQMFDTWRTFLQRPELQHETNSWVHLKSFPMGTRVMSGTGYIPIGCFQMWNPRTSGIKKYPEGHTTAAREDGLFAELWPRAHRQPLAEIVAYHLETEDARMAANWAGRTTKEFK